MEVSEQITKFKELFEESYLDKILENIRKGSTHQTIDFAKLSKFDPDLADMLLETPEEILKAAELAIKEFDLPDDVKEFTVRINNLPKSQTIMIRDIRSKHINKLLCIRGTVRQKSDVRPQVTSARFECPSCGNVIPVLQLDNKFNEPSRCGCGRKGKFRLLSKELVDAQGIVLEEATEDLEGGEQPKRMNIFLKNDLVSPISEKKTNPGSKIQVVGITKEVPIILRSGGKSTKFDLLIEANFVESIEEDFSEIAISKEDQEKIITLSNDPEIHSKLYNSITPSIYGHERIKEALVMQLLGGVGKERTDGVKTRGDMHVLLIGDPGSGKSQMLKRCSVIAPKCRYVSGKGASGAGLCVSPNSTILTNPGGMETIKRVVDDRIDLRQEFRPGVWKKDNIENVRIQSLSKDLKLHSKKPQSIWKLEAPEKVFEVTLSSGKRIELTGNTQLFHIKNGKTSWKKSMFIEEGDYVATPRTLIGGNETKLKAVDIIKSNPVVHNVKPFVKKVAKRLAKKHGTLRKASKELKISENALYYSWVKEGARGNIKLRSLQRISEEIGLDWEKEVKTISLYNGKKHNIPLSINKNLLYNAGLIAGDGDLRASGSTYSVRLSNSTAELHKQFRDLLEKEFKLPYDIQEGNAQRPESTRTHSKILGEILLSLGIPVSPKSDKICMSNVLLHLSNELLAEYISGLYDADGSPYLRKTKGSDGIELTTCSEQLGRQLQLVLLRYDIHATLRQREPSQGRIKGKHKKWIVEIRGSGQFKSFQKHFKLRHPEKIKRLKQLVKKNVKQDTNTDIIPGAELLLKQELQKKKMPLRKTGWHENFSRNDLQRILRRIACDTEELKSLKNIAQSDIFWEKVTAVKEKESSYNYVYDLTVEKSHNFVVDGILVHNTASVVKDEFLNGWSLEAGALVLANKGFCMIDELDKMTKEDRSAMHEALEQQSYHPDTEITMADGSVHKIGPLIDNLMKEDKNRIIQGKDCEILPTDLEVLSTDFSKIFPVSADRISRHTAPKYFIEITYTNGRKITVTPEHPVFVFDDKIKEIPAELVSPDMISPAPRILPTKTRRQRLFTEGFLTAHSKQITLPQDLDNDFSRFLGYHISEGHSYHQASNHYAEIGISNTAPAINNEVRALFRDIFQTKINTNIAPERTRKKATKDLTTIRCCSLPLYNYFEKNFNEVLEKAPGKRIPNTLKTETASLKESFLDAAFKGDGFIDSERFGLGTSSYGLAKDYQDLLLNLGIYSHIATEKKSGDMTEDAHKVVISGYESMMSFIERIVDPADHRFRRLNQLAIRSRNRNNDRDIVPASVVESIDNLLRMVHSNDGYFHNIILKGQNVHIKTAKRYVEKVETVLKGCRTAPYNRKKLNISVKTLAEEMSISPATIYNMEKRNDPQYNRTLATLAKERIKKIAEELNRIKKVIFSDLRFVKVKSVKKVMNKDIKWVYDVTVEPNHTFISEGLVLHNTVSISKANIQATLQCQTTVLAAANPKFGRFDPYELLAKQIDLPASLINRFDLIFPVRDLPDKDKDEKLAKFVLDLHQTNDIGEAEIPSELLRKFIAFARRTCKPKLSDAALKELKDYYVKMRNSGGDEGGVQPIPISARQLEALVRLAESSAKARLGETVTKEDSKRAIELLHYCLSQIGIDPETGKIDIDRISSGITASQRNQIGVVKQIIQGLEEKVGKVIPIDDIIAEGQAQNMDEGTVEEVIEKLKRSGDVFEPKRGFISRI